MTCVDLTTADRSTGSSKLTGRRLPLTVAWLSRVIGRFSADVRRRRLARKELRALPAHVVEDLPTVPSWLVPVDPDAGRRLRWSADPLGRRW